MRWKFSEQFFSKWKYILLLKFHRKRQKELKVFSTVEDILNSWMLRVFLSFPPFPITTFWKCFSKGSWRSDSNLIVWFFDNTAQLSLPVITKRCRRCQRDATHAADHFFCWENFLALSLGLNYAGKRKVPPGLKQVHCGYCCWTQHFDHRGYVGFKKQLDLLLPEFPEWSKSINFSTAFSTKNISEIKLTYNEWKIWKVFSWLVWTL